MLYVLDDLLFADLNAGVSLYNLLLEGSDLTQAVIDFDLLVP